MTLEHDLLLPSLRADVNVTPDPASPNGSGYLLHDRTDNRVWQIGVRERAVLRVLDGTRSLQAVHEALAQETSLGADAVPMLEEVAEFTTQLGREGLLTSDHPAASIRTRSRVPVRRILTFPVRALLRWLVVTPWDMLSLEARGDLLRPNHIRLGSPDRVLGVLARVFRPLVGRALLYGALAYSALGLVLLIGHFDEWWRAVKLLWGPWGLTLVALVGVLAVHIPHQLAHGLVLVHHGARVPSWGVRTLLHLVPTFWVDVSDTMWLTEKRSRLAVTAAGLLWQAVCFTTGLIGWLITDGGVASLVFLALSSTAGFGFVLNANPLARRDAYHLLSTWLDVTDLRRRAGAYLRAWVRWAPMPEPYTRRERHWFAVYALAVNVFGILLTVLAAMFALRLTEQYRETGATLVLFAGGFVFQDHFRSILQATGISRARRWLPRFVVWVLWLAFAAGIAWAMFLPYTYHTGGKTTLASSEQAEVRSELEGLIAEVDVHEGVWVEKGQRIAVLHAPVQERNLYVAEAQLAESKAKQSALVVGRRPEEIEFARSAVLTAEAQLAWSTARAERAKPLYDQKVISQQEYENAEQLRLVDQRKLDEAKAALAVVDSGTRSEVLEATAEGVKSQQAIVTHFRGNIQRTAIVSPISGYVTSTDVQNLRGRYLQPGQRDLVTVIENTRSLVAFIDVPEEDISGVDVDNEVRLYTWSYPGREFRGRVSAIAPVAANDNALKLSFVRVRTEIPNPDGLLKPNMTGYAKIRVEERPVWDILFRPLLRWMRIEVWSWLP
jgi:putative peptide zinc metalloprotease protein